jgi:tryptophan 2,3-dioxygenase
MSAEQPKQPRPTNYWEYIRVDDLLSLQGGVDRDEAQVKNDEVLFIVVHQVYELWFKLVLRELRQARALFRQPRVAEQELSGAVRSLKRATTVLRASLPHWEVMETLTTRDFLAFRDKLFPASGFQSAQLRQIEIVLGLEESERIGLGASGEQGYLAALRAHDGAESTALRAVQKELEGGLSLKHAIDEWLYRTPIDGVDDKHPGSAGELDAFLAKFLAAHAAEGRRTCELACAAAYTEEERQALRGRYAREHESVRAFFQPSEAEGGARRRRIRAAILFIESYRELPLLSWPREVIDALVEFEQLFVIFRQRHARMVERMIGRRTGTGGSAGVDYLDHTALKYRVFRDLWAVRSLQVRKDGLPALTQPDFYEFRNG